MFTVTTAYSPSGYNSSCGTSSIGSIQIFWGLFTCAALPEQYNYKEYDSIPYLQFTTLWQIQNELTPIDHTKCTMYKCKCTRSSTSSITNCSLTSSITHYSLTSSITHCSPTSSITHCSPASSTINCSPTRYKY